MPEVILEETDLWTPNPGGQQGFMDDYTSRYCAGVGGWYSGKTWAGARKLADIHAYNAFDEESGQPTFVSSFIVGQTYGLAKTVNIPEMEAALSEMGLRYRFISDPKMFAFEVTDLGTKKRPSLIYVRSADAASAINGFTSGAGWGDEAARWPSNPLDPKNDPLIQSKGRLRDPLAKVRQLLFTYTNEGDETPIYKAFEVEHKPKHTFYRMPTSENPKAREYASELLGQLDTLLITQYLDGEAVSLAGNPMYGQHEEKLHEDPSVQIHRNLPLQLTMDFNISPGMHGVLGQCDKFRDQYWSRYVLHKPRMSVMQMIDELDRLLQKELKWEPGKPWPWAGSGLELFGDATGGGAEATRGETAWQVVEESLRAHRIPYVMRVPDSNPYVADRAIAVNAALRDARGIVHYRYHPDCTLLKNDFKKMHWDELGDVNKKDKKISHPSDAVGYWLYYLRPMHRPIAPVRGLPRTTRVSTGARNGH